MIILINAFDFYEVGNIPGDTCETFVTVMTGAGNGRMVIGGGTKSPLFYTRHTTIAVSDPACFDSPIAFILFQDDSSLEDYQVTWSKFFGEPGNFTYS